MISLMTMKFNSTENCYESTFTEDPSKVQESYILLLKMKSTKVQTLGVLTCVRDIANDDIVCTWSNIMRMRIFRRRKIDGS